MTKLYSFTCAKCGGVLNVDSDQEILDCPFCGAQIDRIEFHRRDILSQAELCLKRMEYNSAYERYKSLHDKDPRDFEALRGRVLCVAKWSSPEVENRISSFWVNNLRARIEYSLGNALDEDKPYFEKYIEMMDGYSSILEYDNKLMPLKKQYKDLMLKRDNIVVDYDPDEEINAKRVYAREAITETISEIERKISYIENKKKVLVENVRTICGQIKEMDKEWLIRKAKA